VDHIPISQDQPEQEMNLSGLEIRESTLAVRRVKTNIPRVFYQPNFLTRHSKRWIKRQQDKLNEMYGFRMREVPECYMLNPSVLPGVFNPLRSQPRMLLVIHPTLLNELKAAVVSQDEEKVRAFFEEHRKRV
jgi:hypothetical protein